MSASLACMWTHDHYQKFVTFYCSLHIDFFLLTVLNSAVKESFKDTTGSWCCWFLMYRSSCVSLTLRKYIVEAFTRKLGADVYHHAVCTMDSTMHRLNCKFGRKMVLNWRWRRLRDLSVHVSAGNSLWTTVDPLSASISYWLLAIGYSHAGTRFNFYSWHTRLLKPFGRYSGFCNRPAFPCWFSSGAPTALVPRIYIYRSFCSHRLKECGRHGFMRSSALSSTFL